jgi:hypothetical protein
MITSKIKARLRVLPVHRHVEYLLGILDDVLPCDEPASLLMAHTGLNLTTLEGRYLHLLSTPIGRIIPTDVFIRRAHTENASDIGPRVPNTHIGRIRTKLKETDLEIRMHYGLGYQLVDHGDFAFPWTTTQGKQPIPAISSEKRPLSLPQPVSALEISDSDSRSAAA